MDNDSWALLGETMDKKIVVYQENGRGEIAKFIDGVEVVDGVVVDEAPKSGWENVWSFFYSHGATVGGNEWEKKYRNKNYNDNGREYNPASGNWEYTAEANGNADPCDMTDTMNSLFPRGASHGEYPEQYDGT
jgi:hypothetical protein